MLQRAPCRLVWISVADWNVQALTWNSRSYWRTSLVENSSRRTSCDGLPAGLIWWLRLSRASVQPIRIRTIHSTSVCLSHSSNSTRNCGYTSTCVRQRIDTLHEWSCGRVSDLRLRGRGFESHSRCQLTVPSLRDWLMITSDSWSVNGHITHSLTDSAGVQLQVNETEISADVLAKIHRKDFIFILFTTV